MSITAQFILRPVATSLLMAGVLLLGMVAYARLPIASLPAVERPTIEVYAPFPGASPTTVATSLAQPLGRWLRVRDTIEQSADALPGLFGARGRQSATEVRLSLVGAPRQRRTRTFPNRKLSVVQLGDPARDPFRPAERRWPCEVPGRGGHRRADRPRRPDEEGRGRHDEATVLRPLGLGNCRSRRLVTRTTRAV
jgi:hypothetical protein